MACSAVDGRRAVVRCGWLFSLLMLFAGAAPAAPGLRENEPQLPLVFAAASLTDALDAAADAFADAGGPRPRMSYASSAALARQIEHGAPADLFASADEEWMDYLSQRRLIEEGSRVALLGNRLVLVVPAREARTIDLVAGFDLAALIGDRPLAMADPDSVPAGRYGKAALEYLGVWRTVERQVLRAENVRSALTFVERAEAAAGIVYRTDARASAKVAVAGEFPQASHPTISYPFALVAASRSAHARRFLDYLRSPAATRVFREHGFIVRQDAE